MAVKKQKTKAEKNLGGRPTKYSAAFNEQAEKLCKLGATDKELADFFNVNEATLHRWKQDRPGFRESIKAGKALADAMVAESLFKRATGYEHPDVDIKVIENQIVVTDLVKHYPPDTNAIRFWLTNRKPEVWRNKVDVDSKVDVEVIID